MVTNTCAEGKEKRIESFHIIVMGGEGIAWLWMALVEETLENVSSQNVSIALTYM